MALTRYGPTAGDSGDRGLRRRGPDLPAVRPTLRRFAAHNPPPGSTSPTGFARGPFGTVPFGAAAPTPA